MYKSVVVLALLIASSSSFAITDGEIEAREFLRQQRIERAKAEMVDAAKNFVETYLNSSSYEYDYEFLAVREKNFSDLVKGTLAGNAFEATHLIKAKASNAEGHTYTFVYLVRMNSKGQGQILKAFSAEVF